MSMPTQELAQKILDIICFNQTEYGEYNVPDIIALLDLERPTPKPETREEDIATVARDLIAGATTTFRHRGKDHFLEDEDGEQCYIVTSDAIAALKAALSRLSAKEGQGEQDLDFGAYVQIEQKRHGVPNEVYLHKVIGRLKSNAYVDVPVQSPSTETLHDSIEDVVACICCGLSEREVMRYRLADVLPAAPAMPEKPEEER